MGCWTSRGLLLYNVWQVILYFNTISTSNYNLPKDMPTKLDIPKMFFCSGLVISWIYLRFYQMHANGSRGDTADGFAFASFFPNVIQPPIAVFGNTVFSILGKKIYFKRRNHSHMTVSCICLLPLI